VARMRNISTSDRPNGRCVNGGNRRGLALERHDFDLEGLAVGVDMNDSPDVTDLQAVVAHRRGQATRSCSLIVPLVEVSAFTLIVLSRLLPRGNLIPAPVENTGDQQFLLGTVVDHVILDHERAHVGAEFRTLPSHAWVFCEELESLTDCFEQPIRPLNACVGSDVKPGLQEILLCQLRQPIAHQRFLTRAARPSDLMRSMRRRPEALS